MTTTIPERPRLKSHVAIVPISRDNVLVKGPALFVRFSGEAVPVLLDVAPHLDGAHTLAQIASASGHPEEDVRDIVEALVADKVIEDPADDANLNLSDEDRARLAPQLQLFSHLSGSPARAQNRITDARVLIIGAGPVGAAAAESLVASGVGTVGLADGETNATALAAKLEGRGTNIEIVGLPHADITRVFADDYRGVLSGWNHVILATETALTQTFLHVNEAALAENVSWTGVFLDGLEASVGPTVIPGQTACWRCYDLRMKGAHPNLDRLLAYEAHATQTPVPLGLPMFAMLAGAWAAQAVVMTLSQATLPPLAGEVLRLRNLDFKSERHRVLRIPRCPACTRTNIPDVDRYALDTVRLS